MDERLAHGVQCPLPFLLQELNSCHSECSKTFYQNEFHVNFYFHTSLLCLKKVKGLKGLHKNFFRYHKKVPNKLSHKFLYPWLSM